MSDNEQMAKDKSLMLDTSKRFPDLSLVPGGRCSSPPKALRDLGDVPGLLDSPAQSSPLQAKP